MFEAFDVVIFDLDDTLYRETDFLFAGYRRIAAYLHEKHGVSGEEVEAFLIGTFLGVGRGNLFDKLLAAFGLTGKVAMQELLDMARTVDADLKPFPFVDGLLRELHARDKALYVLTNGNAGQQRRKVETLGLAARHPYLRIVYAAEHEPKPSAFCVREIIRETGAKAGGVVLVGDSDIDEMTAKNAGISFIRHVPPSPETAGGAR